jgi:Cu+-exporting ATPase
MPSWPRHVGADSNSAHRNPSSPRPGIGVRGVVDGQAVAIGNTRLMEGDGASTGGRSASGPRPCAWRGASVMFLAVAGQAVGLIAVADPIKASTPEALAYPA